jgi:hypothetical protein
MTHSKNTSKSGDTVFCMAEKSFIFLTLNFSKKNYETLHEIVKAHEYSDVFMNANNHECLGTDHVLGFALWEWS